MTDMHYVYLTDVLSRTDADDFPFVTDGNTRRTWGEFTRAVNGWKLAFTRAGVKRAALYFTELFDSAAALFGAWAAGVTAILPADTARHTCDRLASGLVLCRQLPRRPRASPNHPGCHRSPLHGFFGRKSGTPGTFHLRFHRHAVPRHQTVGATFFRSRQHPTASRSRRPDHGGHVGSFHGQSAAYLRTALFSFVAGGRRSFRLAPTHQRTPGTS